MGLIFLLKSVRSLSRSKKEETITAYLFLLPVIILWLMWFLVPTIQSFGISFYQYSFVQVSQNHFIGFDNFIKALTEPDFYQALKHTLFLAFVAVPVQSILALLLAMALNLSIRFKGGFRTIFYTPYVVSSIAVTTVFMYFFVMDTPVTRFFSIFGMDNTTWYADLKLALPFITIIYVWQQIGFYIVIFLAGLQTIPAELNESAKVDGANSIKRFFYITLPMLKPVIFLVLTFGMIQALQVFDQVAAVAQNQPLGSPAGATSTLVSYFYVQSFKNWDMGYGSAIALLLFAVIFIITMVQKKLLDESAD